MRLDSALAWTVNYWHLKWMSVIGWRIIGLNSDELVSNSPGLYPSHDETFS